jgi:hypothetical protein
VISSALESELRTGTVHIEIDGASGGPGGDPGERGDVGQPGKMGHGNSCGGGGTGGANNVAGDPGKTGPEGALGSKPIVKALTDEGARDINPIALQLNGPDCVNPTGSTKPCMAPRKD